MLGFLKDKAFEWKSSKTKIIDMIAIFPILKPIKQKFQKWIDFLMIKDCYECFV